METTGASDHHLLAATMDDQLEGALEEGYLESQEEDVELHLTIAKRDNKRLRAQLARSLAESDTGRLSARITALEDSLAAAEQLEEMMHAKLRFVFELDRRRMADFIAGNTAALAAEVERRSVAQRGIVISAGTPHYLLQAYITISVIRHHHKSTLPITITYWGESSCTAFHDGSLCSTGKRVGGPLVRRVGAQVRAERLPRAARCVRAPAARL